MADVHSPEKRSYNMSRIHAKGTKPEETVRKYLFSKGFRYRKNDPRLPGKPDIVLPKYKTVVFVNGCFWHRHEGCKYSNSEQVESYFNTLALLDAQQSIHWDMFPPDASFGTIKYGDIVQSIVDFSGYSMKHLNYAVMLYGIENNLYLENLVLNIMREDDIEKLIASNLNISEPNARHILDLLRLSADKKTYYNLTSAACAPFIKVSSTQCVRSIRGFMDRPFDFMLYSLRSNHPKEWDRNTNYREHFFRSQIYSIFNNIVRV